MLKYLILTTLIATISADSLINTESVNKRNLLQNGQITIQRYSKPAAPFSENGQGFSIDISNYIFTRVFGNNVIINDQEEPNNNAMFDKVENYPDTPTNFAISIADTTKTAEREKRFDFSPSYYKTGLKVMTRPDNDFQNIAKQIIINVVKVFGLLLAGVLFLISLLTPIAFFCEFWFCQEKIPIFINWHTRKLENRSTFKLMCTELWNTFIWTSYTFMGVQTGYPNSTSARIVHSIAKLFSKLTVWITIASLSAVMTINYHSSTINGYSDLSGTTVCTVVGTTSEAYIESNNIGFGINRKNTVEEMIEEFSRGACDAVIYDDGLLKNQIVKLKEKNIDAVIVGDFLTNEDYGMIMNTGNPYYEDFKRAFIELNNNSEQMKIFENRWLKSFDNVSGKTNVDVPTAIIIVPCVLGVCLTVVAMVALYYWYEDKNEDFELLRREANDNDYENDLREVLEMEASNITIYKGVDESIDKVLVPYAIRSLRVLYEADLDRKGVDVDKVEEGLVPRKRRRFADIERPIQA